MDARNNTLKYKVLGPALFLKGFIKGNDVPDCNYEQYLTEVLNASSWFSKHNRGGQFERIKEQSHSEPDVVCKNKEYALDYKLLLSSTMAEGKRYHSQQISIENGWTIYGTGTEKSNMPMTIVHRLLADITIEDLEKFNVKWSSHSAFERDIHSIIKSTQTAKNVMFYLPYVFLRNDLTEDIVMKNIIQDELEKCFKTLFQYRDKVLGRSKFDTFLICLYEEKFLVFNWNGMNLQLIDEIETIKSNLFIELVSLYELPNKNKQYYFG